MKNRIIKSMGISVAVTAVFGVWLYWADHFRTGLVDTIQGHPVITAGVISAVILASVVARAWLNVPVSNFYRATDEEIKFRDAALSVRNKTIVAAIVVAVIGAGTLTYLGVQQEYRQANAEYTPSITFTSKSAPEFKERSAFRLADNVLRRNAEDLRGKPQSANYIIENGEGRYTMLVDGEGVGRKLAGVAEWDGEANTSKHFSACRFDSKKVRALDGALWNSLPRQIHNTNGMAGLLLDPDDAYGVCEDGKAKLYWPATDRVGTVNPTAVYGGLIIVDHAGTITLDKDVKLGEYPGPVYPISLAQAQQKAIRATGSFGDFFYERAKVSYDEDGVAGFGENPDENPNTGNTGQFALATTDGRAVYATPLIPNKAGRQVSHLAVIDQDHAKAGTVNKMTVHKLPERRKANSEVSQIIKAEFAGILPFSSGIQIMEITPKDDKWTGTIGQALVATYRFEVDASGGVCLFDYQSGRQLRCSDEATSSDENPGGNPTEELPGDIEDLTALTNEELIELRGQLNEELDSRLTSTVEESPED